MRHDLLHAGSLVSGPTGRLAWQCQKWRQAHVGLVTSLRAKQNQLGLDECSLHMQPRDLRMQPVSSLTKVGAHCNAGAGRLRVGLHGDGEGGDKDRDEQDANHCTNRKPGRTCVARPGSKARTEDNTRCMQRRGHTQCRAERKERATARVPKKDAVRAAPLSRRGGQGETAHLRLPAVDFSRRVKAKGGPIRARLSTSTGRSVSVGPGEGHWHGDCRTLRAPSDEGKTRILPKNDT